jgi:hypothetical protein
VTVDDLTQWISALFGDPAIQRLPKILLAWAQEHSTALLVLVAFAFGYLIGLRRILPRLTQYQNSGEALVSSVLRAHFPPPDYHLMNHVTLQMDDGTTQIDHILVSRFGVFVIETKSYKGWIFADANQRTWTQVLYKAKFRFQNPIMQNSRHVRAVRVLLDFLPPDAIRSVVVFTGTAEFKAAVPEGVCDISELARYLWKQTDEVMSLNRLQFSVGRLETERLTVSRQTDLEHVLSLERRHGDAN